MDKFNLPCKENKKLGQIIARIKEDEEIERLLMMSNITTIDRMGYNDHGPTHVKIVANSSLQILRILLKQKITPSVVKNYQMNNDDAEVVVVIASVLHDIGHAIHRDGHELLSTIIAGPIISRLLAGIYSAKEAEILRYEILQAIYSHEDNRTPLTIEGGVMKVADALDMEKGRARIPYQIGSVNIHSLSAMAIDRVEIQPGETRPVKIIITMSDSAGIFQVDELLRKKILLSGIEKMFTVQARIKKDGEVKVLKDFEL